jgi:hypothetical protein
MISRIGRLTGFIGKSIGHFEIRMARTQISNFGLYPRSSFAFSEENKKPRP